MFDCKSEALADVEINKMMLNQHISVSCCKRISNFYCAVGTTVIDNDQFPFKLIFQGLHLHFTGFNARLELL